MDGQSAFDFQGGVIEVLRYLPTIFSTKTGLLLGAYIAKHYTFEQSRMIQIYIPLGLNVSEARR